MTGGYRGLTYTPNNSKNRCHLHAGVSSGKLAVFRSVVAHSILYSVPATEEQKRQWLRFIFNDNVPATLCVSLFVCANHFTSDCFSNEGQYKAGFASTLILVKGSVPTIPDPAIVPEPQVSVATLLTVSTHRTN